MKLYGGYIRHHNTFNHIHFSVQFLYTCRYFHITFIPESIQTVSTLLTAPFQMSVLVILMRVYYDSFYSCFFIFSRTFFFNFLNTLIQHLCTCYNRLFISIFIVYQNGKSTKIIFQYRSLFWLAKRITICTPAQISAIISTYVYLPKQFWIQLDKP